MFEDRKRAVSVIPHAGAVDPEDAIGLHVEIASPRPGIGAGHELAALDVKADGRVVLAIHSAVHGEGKPLAPFR